MRYILLIFLFATSNLHAQNIGSTDKISVFTRVWGFLKYYHPEVAKGKYDWDSVFIQKIKLLDGLNNKEDMNRFYAEWISQLGEVKKCNSCLKISGTHKNFDNSFISNQTIFSTEVIQQLKWIEANRSTGNNYYAQFKGQNPVPDFSNEKVYADAAFPFKELRLLSLARYWNAIQYYFPYKYAIGREWKEVLNEMIPAFQSTADTMAYHLSLKELVATINDSHAFISTPYINRWVGGRWVPFMYNIIGNKAVASSFFNDSLAKENDIHLGDAVTAINDKPVEAIIKEKWKYASASNDAVKLREMSYMLFNGLTDSVKIRFERDGKILEKNIARYYYPDLKYTYYNGGPDSFRILAGNIGYVNLGWLKPSGVKDVMQALASTKAIVFDVRAYPNDVLYMLAKYLNEEPKPFIKFLYHNSKMPGDFKLGKVTSCGSRNKNYYKGKVIMLFNEQTQSHAEFTLMALQTAPNAVGIGSQTSGADGNVTFLKLPGNYKTAFTAIGVYYPDGRETQRIGIVPDIVVKKTIEGIRNGKDELLEQAIKEANN